MHPLRFRIRVRGLMIVVGASALGLAFGGLVRENRAAAVRAHCVNNLKQIGLGLLNYHESFGAFPTGTVVRPGLPPERRLSWLVLLIGFMEQVRFLIDFDASWDSDQNFVMKEHYDIDQDRTLVRPVGSVAVFHCPAVTAGDPPRGPSHTHYVGIAGVGVDAPRLPLVDRRAGVFGYDRQTRLEDIKDGTSTTMAVAETGRSNGPWTAGGPPTVRGLDPARQPYLGPGRQFGGTHRGGALVLFADGSVRFLRNSIDRRLFEGLSTISGGESTAGLAPSSSP